MSPRELRNWLLIHLEQLEPEIGRPPSEREAAIVREAKAHMYALGGHYDFCLSLPELEEMKTPLACCNQLRRCLAQLETPTLPTNGPYSVEQAAQLLGVSSEKVYSLCRTGELDCTRIGRRVTITQQQLADFQNRPPVSTVQYRHL